MIQLSPQLLIATAMAFVGLGDHASDHAEGGLIDRLRRNVCEGAAPPALSWDVALIHHCGYWSHFDHGTERSSWPLPALRTASELADFGYARGLLREQPEIGDLFLEFSAERRRFVHAGIVVLVGVRGFAAPNRSYVDLVTIEGDTNEGGEVGGGKAMRLVRRLSPSGGDRCLRWTDGEMCSMWGLNKRNGRILRAAARANR